MNPELEKLYSAVSAQFDIGDMETFKNKMATAEDRRKFYDAVSENGYDLGDYDQYESRLGNLSGVSGLGSLITPRESLEPTEILKQQSENVPVQDGNLSGQSSEGPLKGYVDEPESLKAFYELNPPGHSGEVVQQPEEELTLGQSIENSLYNVGTQLLGFDEKLSILSADVFQKILGREATKNWYASSGRDVETERVQAYGELERLSQFTKPTFEFVEGVENRDFAQVLGGAFNAISSLASTAAVSVPTGGSGLFVDMAGQAMVDYNTARAEELGLTVEELYEQGKNEIGTPLAIGTLSAGLEFVGMKGAEKVLMSQLKSQVGKSLLKTGLAWNAEGTTEWLQGGLELINQEIASGDKDASSLTKKFLDNRFSKEGFREYINGVIATAGAAGVGKIGNSMISLASKEKLNEIAPKIDAIQSDLQNAQSDPSTASVLQEQLNGLTEQVAAVIEEDTNIENNISPETLNQVTDINNEITEKQAVVDNPNVSPATKTIIEENVSALETSKEDIISSDEGVPTQTMSEALKLPEGVYTRDGEQGRLVVNGQTVDFEVNDRIYELGNIDEISNQDISEFGIKFIADAPVKIEGNSVTFNGKEYVNNYSDPLAAITRDADERVISVSLETPDGKKRTFRGQNADAIAREYSLIGQEATEAEIKPQETLSPSEGIKPKAVIKEAHPRVEKTETSNTRVNTKESDAVIEQRIREEERSERKKREAPFRPKSDFATQDEYSRYIAQNSNDADQVAREYNNVSPAEPDYIESQIAEYLGNGRINESDYRQYGDINNIDAGKKRRWIDASNDGIRLDVAAQELSDRIGIEVTPAEFIDFVDAYSGIEAFQTSAKSETQQLLEDRYKKLTGRNLTPEISENARNRFNESLTNEDIFEMDSDLQELGITYQDVLNYEEYNREAARVAQEAVQQPENDQSPGEEVSGESETTPAQQKIKPKTPKEFLDRVARRLEKSGLANSITLTDSESINKSLSTDNGKNINGYVDADGNVFINKDVANPSTPIHELAHIWETKVEQDNPALHVRGMELIKTAEGKTYVDYVKRTQPGLQGDAMYKEALAQAIGDNGAELLLKHKQGKIRDWLNRAWEWIGGQVGISNKTPEQIAKMNLQKFSEAVAVDLLAGRPVNSMSNGDILMQTPPKITEREQKKIDFLNKMRHKNGIKYQGNVDAQSLSSQEMAEFVEFIALSIEDGSIPNKNELIKIAKSIGITNSGDIDTAWNIASKVKDQGVGIKKALVDMNRLVEIDYKGLTDAEYIAEGTRLVDEGIVDPNNLVQDIITSPRALQPWEVTALVHHRANVQKDLATVTKLIDKGGKDLNEYAYQGLTGQAAARVRLNAISELIRDFETVMVATANQQSSAFRLRSLITDEDHNIISFLASGKAGERYISPEVVAQMQKLASELDIVKAKLNEKGRQADELQAKINEGNIEAAAAKPDKKSRVNTSKKNKDAFNQILEGLDINSFALSSPKFQANGPIRFQQQATTNLSQAVNEAVSAMRESVNNNKTSIVDAIEQAVESINGQIGKGKWNEMAFRSAVVNSMASQGATLKVKKPYVASDGTLVVPGQYIKSLINSGTKGLESLVTAVKSEVGDSFTDYQVRNAISGYGRVAIRTATEVETEINTAKRVARLLSQIEDLETKGKRATTPKRQFDLDRQSRELINQVKLLEYNLAMTPEERAQAREAKTNETRRNYLNNYIQELQARIQEKDFAPRNHVTKYEKDAETLRLETEAELIRNEFKKAKFETELANRSTQQKATDLAYDLIFNSTRALSAGADLSALGVQGALFTAANPVKAAKAFKSAWSKSFSEAEYEQYFAELQSDPYYEFARKAGLNLQLPSFYQSVQEEQYKGGIATWAWDETVARGASKLAPLFGAEKGKVYDKTSDVNPYKIADRNYSVLLSKMRFDMFKDFVKNQIVKQGLDMELDTEALKETASMINTLTMSSKLPIQNNKLQKSVSAVFFSAPKLLATWKIFLDVFPATGALRAYNRFSRNPSLAKDYYSNLGRGVGAMTAITILPALIAYLGYDEDKDDEVPDMYNPHVLNPIHSDFMKIRLGNTRISLFQGIDGNFVFAARMALGEMMTSSSNAVRELGSSGEKTKGELGWSYISNKFAPTTSAFNKFFLGSDRERYEGAERFKESFYPMWATGAYEQYEDTENPTEATTLGLLGIIGLSYNNYGGAEFAGSKGTNDRKAKSIIEGGGLSVYNPMAGQRKAYDGKTKSEVTGKRFKDVYEPAYEEYMTSIVKASEPKLARSIHWEQKEGLIANMKKQAYKYAEIKTSGVYMDANFAKLNAKSQGYILPKKDYPKKVELIKEFTEGKQAEVYRLRMSRKIEKELKKDGLKPLPEYIEKELDIEVYNEAARQANKKLLRMIKLKEIAPILSTEYIKSEDKWEDE